MERKHQGLCSGFREQTAGLVVETPRPSVDVAREPGIGETPLGRWRVGVARDRRTHGRYAVGGFDRTSMRSARIA